MKITLYILVEYGKAKTETHSHVYKLLTV